MDCRGELTPLVSSRKYNPTLGEFIQCILFPTIRLVVVYCGLVDIRYWKLVFGVSSMRILVLYFKRCVGCPFHCFLLIFLWILESVSVNSLFSSSYGERMHAQSAYTSKYKMSLWVAWVVNSFVSFFAFSFVVGFLSMWIAQRCPRSLSKLCTFILGCILTLFAEVTITYGKFG